MSASFQEDLARIEKDIVALGPATLISPIDPDRVARYVARLYQRASLKGDLRELERLDEYIDRAISCLKAPGDMLLLKANLAFKLHRLADVKSVLSQAPLLLQTPEGKSLQADLDFQEGRYEEARRRYETIIEQTGTWDNLARLAHFSAKMGDFKKAEKLYENAEDELTAKEMRSYAWLRIQRGLLDLTRGRVDHALAHYDVAATAYPGYWMVDEHRAEILAAQGKFDDAVAIYHQVLSQAPRPETHQALGELYVHAGQPALAKPWLDRSEAAYLDSVARGSVHYYHHLVDFYLGPVKNPDAALRWARKDIELRENFSTEIALARALNENGYAAEAVAMARKSLASGVVDAHVFSHATAIFQSAGFPEEAQGYARRAEKLNPNGGHFHVHH